jgi:hypothetical protein
VIVREREGLGFPESDDFIAIGLKKRGREITATNASNWSAGFIGARMTYSARLSAIASASPAKTLAARDHG